MSSKARLKRARLDGIYIFASVFAAFGAFLLIGSYAFSKPAPTNVPGTYKLSKYAVSGTQNTYNLSLSNSRTYCFSGQSLPSALILNPSSSKPTSYALNVSVSEACFNPDKSYDSVDIQIFSSSAKGLTIKVK